MIYCSYILNYYSLAEWSRHILICLQNFDDTVFFMSISQTKNLGANPWLKYQLATYVKYCLFLESFQPMLSNTG